MRSAILIGLFFFLGAACTLTNPTEKAAPTLTLAVTATPIRTATAPLTATSLPTDTPAPATAQTDTPTPQITPAISEADLEEMEDIQRQVSELRGLQPVREVEQTIFTPQELEAYVIDLFAEDYGPEQAQIDLWVLSAFGLLEPDFDLYPFLLDLYSEQIAGFYDSEKEQMVIVQGGDFGGPERMTYAHEYTHALQDQTYDIEEGLNIDEQKCEADSERCAAIQALMEGDATLAGLNWLFGYGTPEDLEQVMASAQELEMPILDTAPEFIRSDLLFPYTAGAEFVQYLFEQGGWGAVDQAYQELPQSTEHILHPERYPQDQPLPVTLPDLGETLGAGWREVDRDDWGEWYTLLLLTTAVKPEARLSLDAATAAAEGWGGDEYVVYVNDQTGELVLVLTTQWDDPSEAEEFASAFSQYASARFGVEEQSQENIWDGEAGYSEFRLNGDQTTWVLAPDSALAGKIWATLGE